MSRRARGGYTNNPTYCHHHKQLVIPSIQGMNDHVRGTNTKCASPFEESIDLYLERLVGWTFA